MGENSFEFLSYPCDNQGTLLIKIWKVFAPLVHFLSG